MGYKDFTQTEALGPDTMFLHPDAHSVTSPAQNTTPKTVMLRILELSKIPNAMRQMGWDVSAALMQRWFDSPAWTMPPSWKDGSASIDSLSIPSSQCDDRVVTMAWAMHFPRCREAFDELKRRVDNSAATGVLNARLSAAGWDGTSAFRLGAKTMNARQLDATAQVNALSFGKAWNSLDDMYGALGASSAKIGVVGDAMYDIRTDRKIFHVTHIGTYIRDTYDFNGTQFLGVWQEDRILTKGETLADMFHDASVYHIDRQGFGQVWNRHFEAYRTQEGMGGDFILYSDVLWQDIDMTIDLGPAS
jgi:hypothetical protein